MAILPYKSTYNVVKAASEASVVDDISSIKFKLQSLD